MQKLETKLNVQNKAQPQPLSLTQPQFVGQQQKATEILKDV